MEGALGRGIQRGDECGRGSVIFLEASEVSLVETRVTRMRAGDRGRDRTIQRRDRNSEGRI